MTRRLSVVIPVCNEQDSVSKLHEQLKAVAEAEGGWWEFIFVDDGSRDKTWEALLEVRMQDPRVRAIRFKRNFGQTAAMACGVEHAKGDIIVTMDGDLQNDPRDIPKLLAKLDEDFDVVCGWRYHRQDKLWTRKIPSLVANRLIGWLTGVPLHDYGCSLKAYRAEVIKRTPLYAEFHRFIPALSTLTGALIAEIKVNHHPRRFGRTKYNLSRTWRVALDMLTVSALVKSASKPLRLFGMLAFGCAAVSAVCIVRSWEWYVGPYTDIPQVLPGVAVLTLWLACHLLMVGWAGELCLVTAHERAERLLAPKEHPNG